MLLIIIIISVLLQVSSARNIASNNSEISLELILNIANAEEIPVSDIF
jgi:hypothetical protein